MAKRKRADAEEWLWLRYEVLDRQRQQCAVCGLLLENTGVLHHRLRRSQGGPDEAWNLIGCHPQCHDRIHAEPEVSFAKGWLVRSSDTEAWGHALHLQ